MASHRRTSLVKSRNMGSNIAKPVTTTSSAKQRPHPSAMKANSKYKPKAKPTQSLSCLDTICSYKNYLFFTCLCLWSTSILIMLITRYKSSHNSTPFVPAIVNTNRDLQINDMEPAWKHPIQPWEILPRPPKGPPPPMKCTWKGPFDGFLSGCANDACHNHNSIDSAKEVCSKDELCTGIVQLVKDREIYQLRSGGKVSESPSGEQSWQKSCVVDQQKLDEMHKNELQKLDGKDSSKNSEAKAKRLADRMEMKKKSIEKEQLETESKNRGPDLNAVKNDVNEAQSVRKLVEGAQFDHIARNLDAQAIAGDDPWSKFIPEMAQINADRPHVYDDNNDNRGYQRPFGEEDNEIIGELNMYEKADILKNDLLDPNSGCFLEGPLSGFIANCATDNCDNYQSLDDAIDKCLEYSSCTGVVQIVAGQSIYQLRSDKKLRDSPRSEVTWVKLCGQTALDRIEQIAAETPPPHCFLDGPIKGFLGNCAAKVCQRYYYFNDAMVECEAMGDVQCVGVTRIPGLKKSFELRAIAPVISSESGEYSYLLECGGKQAPIDRMDDPLIAQYEKIGNIIQIDDHHTNEIVQLQTIYIGIASYRDSWCYKSVHTAFARARYPERIFIGVVQQNAPGDPECIEPEIPCEEDPTQVLCKYVSHIRVKRIDAKNAAGPTFGRHFADTLYDGEYFAVQVDAHMSFIKDWDMIAIAQWNSLSNEYAILSTYPSEIKSGLDEYGNRLTLSAPIICNTRLLHNGMFKHEAAGEITFPESHKDKPMLSPFLGAGIMFSRGHRIVRVPYDCCLPMIFDGEEFSMGARVWTHGYDLYAPSESFVYHPYNRKKRPPLFWENQDGGRSLKSQNRIRKVLGMSLERGQEQNYDATDIQRYGLGTQRDFSKYLSVFGINLETNEIYNHCAEAFAGILHDRLHAYLRPNRRGINYDFVFVAAEHKGDGRSDGEEQEVKVKKSKRKKSYLDVAGQREQKKKIGG